MTARSRESAESERRARGLAPWCRPTLLEMAYWLCGTILLVRYFWVMDDALVYFRFVDNFVFLDLGLVYNEGEYVEGYSSPFFCLLLAALRSLHLGYHAILLVVGCGAFAAFWYLLVVTNRMLSGGRSPVFDLPAAYLCASYGPLSFFTSGLETPLTQLLAPAVALFILRPYSRVATLMVAIAPLVRPELGLATLACAAFACWRLSRFPWLLVATTAAANLSWLCFRVYYYADLLPNTFYVKNVTHWGRGWIYLEDVVMTYGLWLVVGVVGALFAWTRRRERRSSDARPGFVPERLVMLGISAAYAAYVVRVGGAHVHYWYLAFPFCLVFCALGGVLESGARWLPGLQRGWSRAASMALVALFSLTRYPLQEAGLVDRLEPDLTRQITGPEWHRRHPDLQPRAFEQSPAELVEIGRRVRDGGYDGVVQNAWASDAYQRMDERVINSFGLTDAILARVDTTSDAIPGHSAVLPSLGYEILKILRAEGGYRDGIYREAVESGDAPEWIADNLDAIEVIGRKVHNRHDPLSNLRLALSFPEISIDRDEQSRRVELLLSRAAVVGARPQGGQANDCERGVSRRQGGEERGCADDQERVVVAVAEHRDVDLDLRKGAGRREDHRAAVEVLHGPVADHEIQLELVARRVRRQAVAALPADGQPVEGAALGPPVDVLQREDRELGGRLGREREQHEAAGEARGQGRGAQRADAGREAASCEGRALGRQLVERGLRLVVALPGRTDAEQGDRDPHREQARRDGTTAHLDASPRESDGSLHPTPRAVGCGISPPASSAG